MTELKKEHVKDDTSGPRNPEGKRDSQSNYKPRQRTRVPQGIQSNTSTFRGPTPGLEKDVFDNHPSRSPEMFQKTKDAMSYYAGRTYSLGSTIQAAIEDMTLIDKPEPTYPADDTKKGDLKKWEKRMDAHIRREQILEEELGRMYGVIWAQCSPDMKTAIEAEEEYATAKNDRDPIVLLEIIRQILFDSNTKKHNPYVTMRSAKRKLYTLFQNNMSLDDYHKRFTSQIEVIEHLKGVIMKSIIWQKSKHKLSQ